MRAAMITAALLIAACGSQPGAALIATDVVVTRPVTAMGMSAAYLSLTNTTPETIRISRVASTQYGSVQIHETTVENGVARMRALAALEIPGGGSVTLERGGKHLMLMRPTGEFDSVTLQFFDDENLVLTIDARMESESG